MPRIDPFQLLKCLSVLLSPEAGILSHDEVPRLVNLMTKFSKKLVSKCVYILILRSTEQSLVNLFMNEGGWNLIHTWLQDAIKISNWDLVQEILALLLVVPIEVDRLKLNNIPKLVKSLSRLDEVKGVQDLASQLVRDWLVMVKGNNKTEEGVKAEIKTEILKNHHTVQASTSGATVDSSQINNIPPEVAAPDVQTIPTNSFYTVSLRDGKQVISKAPVEPAPEPQPEVKAPALEVATTEEPPPKKEKKDDKSSKSSDKSRSKSRSSSSSSKHSSSKSSSSSSSRDKHRSSSSSSSKSSSRDKDRDKKDRHKSNGTKSSSSSSSSSASNKEKGDPKEKQAEKDKDTLAKIRPQSIDKLGRIPKKTDDKKETKETKVVKKPTMSIEVRKGTEDRPKTVKVFNSKRRTTGLEEEAKPPPPLKRNELKKPAILPPIPLKRSSPIRDLPVPPEKKLKIELPERPGAIKLIPPKPKPALLQESDLFMDAIITASATTKKEAKKRKRRSSVSKDTPESPTAQKEPSTPTSPPGTSPLGLKNIAAPNFYQDTLDNSEETVDEKEEINTEEPEQTTSRANTPVENIEVEAPVRLNEYGIKGVLLYTKRKGPKKTVKFNDNDLTQVRFFELDETERVNVTKTFMDMAKMDISCEREALQMSRKLPNEDTMEPQTMWRLPFLLDQKDPLAPPGSKSLEKDIQFAREKSTLQALYFDKRKIPDSAEEPIAENHQMNDPIVIPLEDADSQEMDLRNTPWPEPKGSPPHQVPDNPPPQIFPNNIPIPFQNFPPHGAPPGFQGMPPRFGPPGPYGPPNMGPNMMPNGNMMGPPNMGPPPEMMHPGPLNPNAFGPGPDSFPPMMHNDNNYNNMPFNPPNMGMFPPNNFNMNRGGNRGGFRRGGNNNGPPGPWIRMNGPGPGNWNNRGGGGGRGGGRICKNVKNHGFCRNMDKCPFFHPK